jgi:hypothetical protein
LLSLLAGFVGGLVSGQLGLTRIAGARADQPPIKVVTAKEFRLVDEQGRVRGTMTVDKDGDARLRLTGARPGNGVELDAGNIGELIALSEDSAHIWLQLNESSSSIDATDRNNIDRLSVNIFDNSSYLNLTGPDGKKYVLTAVSKSGSSISAGTDSSGGGEEFAAAVSASGEPSLTLSDTRGRDRAVLGTVDLQSVATGSTKHRSPSSLVLFGEDGKVVWSSP